MSNVVATTSQTRLWQARKLAKRGCTGDLQHTRRRHACAHRHRVSARSTHACRAPSTTHERSERHARRRLVPITKELFLRELRAFARRADVDATRTGERSVGALARTCDSTTRPRRAPRARPDTRHARCRSRQCERVRIVVEKKCSQRPINDKKNRAAVCGAIVFAERSRESVAQRVFVRCRASPSTRR